MSLPILKTIVWTAIGIIKDESRWTTYEDARRSDGTPCHPCDPTAATFSALGALIRAESQLKGDTPSRKLGSLSIQDKLLNALQERRAPRIWEIEFLSANNDRFGRENAVRILSDAVANIA